MRQTPERTADTYIVDSAGASARREYERRRANRERDLRERHPRIGGLLFTFGEAPQHERAWELGAQGEERAASRLAQLLSGSGVVLLHDRRIPPSRANIDHIAVGPGGVTVIDTKRLNGKVEVRGRGAGAQLRVAGWDRSNLLTGVERQLSLVKKVVGEVDVRAALCFVDPDGLPLLRRLRPRGVLVDSTRSVAALARRSGNLDAATVQAVVERLAAAFPKAVE